MWLCVTSISSLEFVFFFFFFFKQKTAYEMRISDWSSDVCSSDLRDDVGAARPIALGDAGIERRLLAELDLGCEGPGEDIVGRAKPFDGREIGRASCRERVCQYV